MIVDTLSELQKKTNLCIKTVRAHENDLEIMVNGIEEPEKEDNYKSEHRNIIIEESELLKDYRIFKTQFFELVKGVIKTQKQKRLLQ